MVLSVLINTLHKIETQYIFNNIIHYKKTASNII